jgi:hypothetical protein
MKKKLEEMSYAEQVAALCEGLGALDGLDMVQQHAAYVAQAEGWEMSPSRCAANVVTKGNRRGF